MLVTISRIHQHFHWLRPFRPALLLTALAALYALMNPRHLSTDLARKTFAAKMFTAMGVMACLSVPFGLSIGAAGVFILNEYSKVLVFAYLTLLAIRSAADLYKLVWAMTMAGGALAWLSLFVFRISKATGDGIARIQNGYSYDSNDLGLVAVLCMVLAILTWQVSGTKGKMASLIVITGLGAAIARTGSRGAFLTLMVVGVAFLFLVEGVSAAKKGAFVALTFVALLIAAPEGYWAQMNTITAPTEDYNWSSTNGRREVFLRGLGYFMTNPVTGIGVDNFGRAEGELSARAEAREFDPSMAGVKWSAPHNSFLEAMVEMGLPGLVIFSSMIFGSIYRCVKLRRKMIDWDKGDDEQRFMYFTSLYLPVAFLGFVVGGSLVSFAYLDPIYVLTAFAGGLEISFQTRQRRIGAQRDTAHVSAPPTERRYRGGLPPMGATSSVQ